MNISYVHGYDPKENTRLQDQASTLIGLLHADTSFPSGSRILEVGCGIGAQTVILARNSPGAAITAVDISPESLTEAQKKTVSLGITHVTFLQADIFNLPFEEASFDHVFVCFVLEHLSDPVEALHCLKNKIKPGGSITVIEGDHGSVYFYPDSEEARQAIRCQIILQAQAGGNACIGRELYPLLRQSGYRNCHVSPRTVYVDARKPNLVEGFTRNTFTAMIEGIRDKVLKTGLLEKRIFEQGIADLYRTTEDDGVFCYTFFKAYAEK